jgi:hypothetical protein
MGTSFGHFGFSILDFGLGSKTSWRHTLNPKSKIQNPKFLFSRDLCHDGFCQTIGRDEAGSLAMKVRQARLAGGVDAGHPSQVDPQNRTPRARQRVVPAAFEFSQPWSCHASLELEGQEWRSVVNSDAQHS